MSSLCVIYLIISPTVAAAATPVVTYGTYFGTAGETGTLIAVAPNGEVVVVGTTTSETLPGTSQAFQPSHAIGLPNNVDVFVAKFDPTGKTLLWTTFLGGDGRDLPVSVAVNVSGEILVSGSSTSSNFPIKSLLNCPSFGIQFKLFVQPCTVSSASTYTGISSFVSKLSPDGRNLVFSTGSRQVTIGKVASDSQGGSFFTGTLGIDSLFLFHLTPNGNTLSYGSYLGPADGGPVFLTVDSVGNCYVYGGTSGGSVYSPPTSSTGPFATTPNALQSQYSNLEVPKEAPLRNGFLLEVDPTGSKLLYGTYYGPKYADTTITGVIVVQNSVYITGSSNAASLQTTTPGAYLSTPPTRANSAQNYGYVAKLTPGASTFDSFSYLGTSGQKLLLGTSIHVLTPDLLVEVGMPTLGPITTAPNMSFADFALTSQSTWVVGNCNSSSCLIGVPSTGAYQSQGFGQSTFLAQIMDLNISIASVVNAASLARGPLTPGQLATIFGSLLGSTPGASGQVVSGAFGTSVGGTQASFDGILAPIFYAGPSQINVAIPCALSGHTSTQLVVTYNGASSTPFMVPLTVASPAIFTLNGSGLGQAAVFNQDSTLNGPTNPAARGSAVALFATGLPSSSCADGQILPGANSISAIGGINNEGAQVLYAGQAPGSVSGLQQVNLLVPSDSATGSAIQLVLSAAGQFSPAGITVAVK